MHDIICPHCGESFIASDVAFDLSSYVLPLLYSDPKDGEDVKSVGFKYYVDEDTISKNAAPGNTVPLLCDRPGGPDRADPWFPLVITNKMLLTYIEEQVTLNDPLDKLLTDVMEIQKTRGAKFNVMQEESIQLLYSRFFSIARDSYTERFDLDDANVQIALKILLHIYQNPDQHINLRVRVYSSMRNPNKRNYRVPDILFILKNGMIGERHHKCCRYCGTTFPAEYGYYKMMPIVLLGSHYAGKTSYLLSLLYTIRELPPFSQDGVGNKSINATTLNDDNDLVAFSKNIEHFKAGEDPDKTDFANVPILNLLINNIIYTFIDWPGEKFIDGGLRHNDQFVYQTRRVICKARHFLCFLEPSQIDLNRVESEERVRFSADALVASFDWHMFMTDLNRLRSITFIVNKIDLFLGDENNDANPNAGMILDLTRNKAETSVYVNGTWSESEFQLIDKTTQDFIQIQNPILLSSLNNMPNFTNVPKAFVPVAPYGERKKNTGSSVVHRTRLAGVPLLRIMELDKKLI